MIELVEKSFVKIIFHLKNYFMNSANLNVHLFIKNMSFCLFLKFNLPIEINLIKRPQYFDCAKVA